MSDDTIVAVEVRIINETDRALLVTSDKERDAEWVPLSLCEVENRDQIRNTCTLHLPEWKAIQAGLV
ncbi:hypothetical protein [Paracoccus alkanivorans]|uniref:Uncharacterized protein n=1 Tax=Paracoccus alkanivorans TaxID=2116655 RepID=A0A3M0M7G7_9RHOB|nr:hypothetical protein [Paracoccus alkanivorans]RMC33738.1 hypothetical protein C9E81_15655 [Paracoccus alkanivorans]